MSLTIKELEEKIERVDKDIETLRAMGDASRKTETLIQYKDYLKDELSELKKMQ